MAPFGFLGDREPNFKLADLARLGAQLLAQQHEAQDLAGSEAVTTGSVELPVVKPPAGPLPSRARQIPQKVADCQVLGAGNTDLTCEPSFNSSAVDIEFSFDTGLADQFDETLEVMTGLSVDLQNRFRLWGLPPR